MTGNATWKTLQGGDAEGTETKFLLNICSVVGRLIDEEWRLLQSMWSDVVAAGVANHYVNVVVSNASIRAHAAVHRHFDDRSRPPNTRRVVTKAGQSSCGDSDAALDLRVLAGIRKQVFMARLEQAAGVEDWRPTTTRVADRIDEDEAAARRIISDEVDRFVKDYCRAVRENLERCDLLALAWFGYALRHDSTVHSAATHRAVTDTVADQLWTCGVDAASHLLADRLTTISPMTTTQAADRVSQLISNHLSRSRLTTVCQ